MSPVIFSRALYRAYYSKVLTRVFVIFPARLEKVVAAVYCILFSFCLGIDRCLTFALCGFDPLLTAECFEEEMRSCERLEEESRIFRKRWQAEYRGKPRVKLGDIVFIKKIGEFPPAERLVHRLKNSFLFKNKS